MRKYKKTHIRVKLLLRIFLCVLFLAAAGVIVTSAVRHDDILSTCRWIWGFIANPEETLPGWNEESLESNLQFLNQEFDFSQLPEWDESTAYVTVHEGIPYFTEEEKSEAEVFFQYSELDSLGRTGAAFASMNLSVFPLEERDDSQDRLTVFPSGWNQQSYPDLVEHDYLYNRCHLIAWRFCGESVAEGLITGTRYMNIEGMGTWEQKTAEYAYSHPESVIKYRVTPVYIGSELTCRGVLMEGYADSGALQFCVFCYNEQPGITIQHLDGSSSAN